MQHAAVPGDLQVQRQRRLEAVLPVDLEAEEVDVELARLRFIEDAQDRNRPAKVRGFHS
jgi:hypothetical protein